MRVIKDTLNLHKCPLSNVWLTMWLVYYSCVLVSTLGNADIHTRNCKPHNDRALLLKGFAELTALCAFILSCFSRSIVVAKMKV